MKGKQTAFPIAVLVSGSGSNLQAIIDAKEAGWLNVDIKLVLSNKSEAYALTRAKNHGIPTHVISHQNYSSREDFDQEMTNTLQACGAQLIVLAGFMRLLSSSFVKHWRHKIINIHPSLLPAFPGLHAQRQALEHGVKFAGCSVFYVDEGTDTGPIIQQAVVPVQSEDTEDTLTQRILKMEHQILPQSIQWIAQDKLSIQGRTVHIMEEPQPSETRRAKTYGKKHRNFELG